MIIKLYVYALNFKRTIGTHHFMTDAQVKPYLDKFDAADAKKKGQIDYAAFKPLIGELLGKDDDRTAQVYFDGIDIDGSKQIGRDEFKAFVVAALTKDTNYTLKLVFRAFDKDRSRELDAKEIKEVGRYVGRELTDEEIETGIQRVGGKKGGKLKYSQVVKLITNKEVDPNTDPYDGKLKSGCCLLL
jgi:Ca2+-binding EF-hand superfamily protein